MTGFKELGAGNLYTNRENEVLFEAQTSRYINEFDEISRLGKGGYGTVYKVRNKLDGQFYAIKKIIIEKATKRDCMKVLREVKVLAGLQHPNIVGYHTAWMEHVQPACPKGEYNLLSRTALQLPSLKMSSGPESVKDLSSIHDTDDSDSIIFANLSPEDSTGPDCEGNRMSVCELSGDSQTGIEKAGESDGIEADLSDFHHINRTSSYCSSEERLPKEMSPQKQCEMEYHVMLHIQMQLCELSLWDWIADRNGECFRSGDVSSPYCHVDVNGTLKIFQELLEGVYYIHSRGVMHRDIKPRNIFLQGSDHHVKIGDFGLACQEIIQETTSHLLSAKKMELPPAGEISHTSGVGTCLYASLEQLQGCHYDFKSDMYSLGVILLELFQPFGTEMERTEVLMDLRKGHIPLPFSQKWPTQTKYVKLLTSKVPSRRPTASQVLESELFCSTASVICNLQQKVMQQEEEIKLLNETIKLLLQDKERDKSRPLGSPV
ncbi:hypothetical protein lerEdw1_018444 [Lerista edwardsae]|nr:hypothetical protein lerEdw1_018444 [Lerista edwardsae]